jgi:hypothetical protein
LNPMASTITLGEFCTFGLMCIADP